METFDIVIIGSGPAGYIAAIEAAQRGNSVAVIEKDRPGGVCLNVGCIPSKAILKAAEFYMECKHADSYGISLDGFSCDYAKVIERSRKAADKLSRGIEYLFRKNKITLIRGVGTILTPSIVGIHMHDTNQDREMKTKHIILASGTTPVRPNDIPIDGTYIMTSDEAILATELPESITIIGGGAIGDEFAYIYNSFGSKVTLIEMTSQLLPGSDHEIAIEFEKQFVKQGITVLTHTKLKSISRINNTVETIIEDTISHKETKITSTHALIAVGRRALTEHTGIKEMHIDTDERGFVKIDESYMTTKNKIYGIGDVIGPPLLAHKGSAEGIIAIDRIHGGRNLNLKRDNIPSCIYAQPEIAWIGITEDEARKQGYTISIGKFPFLACGKAVAIDHPEGFVKIISDSKTHEILGGHIIGHNATELIAEICLAKSAEITPAEIALTVHAHPTLSESVMGAAMETIGKAHNI